MCIVMKKKTTDDLQMTFHFIIQKFTHPFLNNCSIYPILFLLQSTTNDISMGNYLFKYCCKNTNGCKSS